MSTARLFLLLCAALIACASPKSTEPIGLHAPAPFAARTADAPESADAAQVREPSALAEPDPNGDSPAPPVVATPDADVDPSDSSAPAQDLSWAALIFRLSGGLIAPGSAEAAPAVAAPRPSFTVVARQDISLLSQSRLVVRVVMPARDELPPYPAVRAVADAVFESEGSDVDELTVFIYLPEMSTSGAAFGVAEYLHGERQRCSVQHTSLFGTKWYAMVVPPTQPSVLDTAPSPAPRATLRPGQEMLSAGKHIAMMHKADMEHLTDLLLQGDGDAAQQFVALGVATGVARLLNGSRAVYVVDRTFLSGLRQIRIPGDPQPWWVGRGAFE